MRLLKLITVFIVCLLGCLFCWEGCMFTIRLLVVVLLKELQNPPVLNSFRRKKDSFYVIPKIKYSFCRNSNPRSMNYEANSLPLGYLTCCWICENEVQNMLYTNQSGIIRNCQKMANCEQFRKQCCVKTAGVLTLASTHVFLIKMCQESYNRRESWVF